MKILNPGSFRTTPWKNGGGTTTEIAAAPTGASVENFDWRVSMARINSDGPFSHFPGVDRTLAVIDGSGVELTINRSAPVRLSAGSKPLSFSGEEPAYARLLAGEVRDLNVMTRRGHFAHKLLQVDRPTSLTLTSPSDVAIVLSLHGDAAVCVGARTEMLSQGAVAVVTETVDSTIAVKPSSSSVCYLIFLKRTLAG